MILNGLFLTIESKDDLVKFQISHDLLKEEQRLSGLGKYFRSDIDWV